LGPPNTEFSGEAPPLTPASSPAMILIVGRRRC
jgi:hypothetical protein